MKGFRRFSSIVLAICFLSLAAACSNMETPEIEQDAEETTPTKLFNKIASGEKVTACYVMADLRLFMNDERIGDKWEEVDLEDFCGWETSLPYRINIIDSRVALPYKMNNLIDGGSLLSMLWYAYCIATDTHPQLSIFSEMEVDKENNTVRIGHLKCNIESETNTGFRLNYDSQYRYHGTDGSAHEGTYREKLAYNLEILDEAARDNMWIYESEYDLIVDLLARLRATLGDEVDLNEYLYPNVILDEPIVNFDELETALLAKYSR